MPRPVRYRRRPSGDFQVPARPHTGPTPPPEVLPWYWHPNREGGQPPPAAFAEQMKRIDPDLRVVFSPVHERWIVWVRNERRVNSLCTGWQLLFLWEHPTTHAFLPLNELLFHNLYLIDSNRYRNGVQYFEQIQARIEQAKADRLKQHTGDRQSLQSEIRQSWQISTAGKGNKFAQHHDGSIELSKGSEDWRRETRKHRLPSEMLKQEQDDREKAEYGE